MNKRHVTRLLNQNDLYPSIPIYYMTMHTNTNNYITPSVNSTATNSKHVHVHAYSIFILLKFINLCINDNLIYHCKI
jgi:hypothetical protein